MISNKQFTKLEERDVMLDLLRQRESRMPNHPDPQWIHQFWDRRIAEHSEIKRILGVGMTTMSDHLRIYKDPFESCGPQMTLRTIEAGRLSPLGM